MAQYLTDLNMRVSTCSCGISWAAPEKWFKTKERTHETFYCPNGCSRHFPEENKEERLKRQLNSVQECCTRYEQESESLYRSNIALKGHLTRKKKQLQVV